MFAPLFAAAQIRAEDTVKRGILSLGAVLLLVVGVGFLAAAAWLVLAELRSAIFACMVVGLVLVGLALLLALVARRKRVPVVHPGIPPQQAVPPVTAAAYAPSLAQAFLTGLNVGLRGRKR